MSDEQKDAIRGSELADEAGPASDAAPAKDDNKDLAEDGIRGDGLATDADE